MKKTEETDIYRDESTKTYHYTTLYAPTKIKTSHTESQYPRQDNS